jgi:hypothetical protein
VVDLPPNEVLNYLKAANMVGTFIAVGAGGIKRVGWTTDLAETVTVFDSKGYQLAWIVWGTDFKDAEWLCYATRPLWVNNQDAAIVSAPLEKITEMIADVAVTTGRRIAPHDYIVQAASKASARAIALLNDLNAAGQLKDFNKSYQTWRVAEKQRGRRVDDYRDVFDRLMVCMIKALIREGDALANIRTEFPWLSRHENAVKN